MWLFGIEKNHGNRKEGFVAESGQCEAWGQQVRGKKVKDFLTWDFWVETHMTRTRPRMQTHRRGAQKTMVGAGEPRGWRELWCRTNFEGVLVAQGSWRVSLASGMSMENFNSCLEKIQNWEVIRHLLLVLYLCFLQKSLQNVCSITNFLSVSACHSDSVKCWLSFCYRPHMDRLPEMCLLALCGSGRSGSLVFTQQRWLACVSSCSCSLPIREWEGLYSTPAPWQVRFLPQYRPVHPFGPCVSEGEAPGSRTYLSQCQCGTCHIGQACLTTREPGNVREQKTSGWAWPSRPCTPTFKTSQWESLEVKCLIQSHTPQTYPALSSLSVYAHIILLSLIDAVCIRLHVCMCVYVCVWCMYFVYCIYLHAFKSPGECQYLSCEQGN